MKKNSKRPKRALAIVDWHQKADSESDPRDLPPRVPRIKRLHPTRNILVQLDDEVALRLRMWSAQRRVPLWHLVQEALLRSGMPTLSQFEATHQAEFLRD